MSDARSDRLAAGTGVLAAVLLAAGFVLTGVDAPGSDTSRADIVATYTDDATNARQALGVLSTGLGALFFVPFLSHLRIVLGRNGGDTGILPGAAYAGGLLLVAGVVAGAVMDSAVSAGDYFDGYSVNADVVMTTVVAGYYFYGFAAMAGGVLITAAAVVARRSGLLPGWLTGLGYVVAALSIPAAVAGMWVLVESLWIAIAAGLLARRSAAGQRGGVRVGGRAPA